MESIELKNEITNVMKIKPGDIIVTEKTGAISTAYDITVMNKKINLKELQKIAYRRLTNNGFTFVICKYAD